MFPLENNQNNVFTTKMLFIVEFKDYSNVFNWFYDSIRPTKHFTKSTATLH